MRNEIVNNSTTEVNRKEQKNAEKLRKLMASARKIDTLDGYERVLNDKLFNRSILEIILIRMENQTAFASQTWERQTKDILKIIVENPLVTTDDIIRIKKMKSKSHSKYSSSQVLYNSTHINTALSNKTDLPKEKIMAMVKLSQFNIKIQALKRDDLTDEDKQLILDYAIKHHSQTPRHITLILEELGKLKLLKDDNFRKKIIEILKKKYKYNNNWGNNKPNGIQFLVVIDEYGWMDYLTDSDKKEMSNVIVEAFKRGSLPKDKILKIIDNLEGNTSGFLLQIYEQTNDEDFLPKKVKDIFLF